MKKLLVIVSCCFFLLFAATSCKSTGAAVKQNEPVESSNSQRVITERVHDTIFQVAKDSSYYQALIDCQNGKAVIKETLQQQPGRKLKSPGVRVVDNKLMVDCASENESLRAQLKDRSELQTTNKTLTVTKEVNRLTLWQQLEIKLFWTMLILLLLFIIWQLIKSRIKL